MLNQINMIIVFFFLGLIIVSFIILLAISPKAVQDVKLGSLKPDYDIEKGISAFMEELSRTRNIDRIKDITSKISEIIKEQDSTNKSQVQIRKTKIIKQWLSAFSMPDHIRDLKDRGISRQVQFDGKTKDFKLVILKK